MTLDIIQLNKAILDFLLEKRKENPDLRFQLRDESDEKLVAQGYYFPCDDRSIYISFWEGIDSIQYTPIISFGIIVKKGLCALAITSSSSEDTTKFVNYLTSLFDIPERVSNNTLNFSAITYVSRADNIEVILEKLEGFLQKDKIKIDNIIKNQLSLLNINKIGGLGFIENNDFQRRLNFILAPNNLVKIEKENEEVKSTYPHISNLFFTNIGHFSSIKLDLSKQVVCFVGENGSGKSTLLRSIALALSSKTKDKILVEETISNFISVERISGKTLYKDNSIINLSIFYKSNHFIINELITLYLLFNKKENYVNLGVKKNSLVNNGLSPVKQSLKDDKNYFKFLILGFPQSDSKNNEVYPEINEPNDYDLYPLIYECKDNRTEKFKNWVVNQYFLHLETKQERSVHSEMIEFIFKIISDIVSTDNSLYEIKFLGTNKDLEHLQIYVSTPENPYGIPFDLLSTGLNTLFSWIGYFLRRLNQAYPEANDIETLRHQPAIILYDEIDNNLHPQVQAKLMPLLLKAFPNTQFIISTHSPIVVSTLSHEDSLCYVVEKEKVTKVKHFYGRRVQDILYDYYGMNERPSQEMNQKVEGLIDAINQDNRELVKSKLAELKPILGENDPIILDATYYLEEEIR